MHYEVSINKKKLDQWLAGISLQEKIKTLERGKLVRCIRCNKIFFDKEDTEERQLKSCKPTSAKHDCVEFENYIILRRGFAGIRLFVSFQDGENSELAVLRYFGSVKIRR